MTQLRINCACTSATVALVASAPPAAQHAVSVRVTDEHSGAPLPGATVVADLTPPVGASTGPELDGALAQADGNGAASVKVSLRRAVLAAGTCHNWPGIPVG